MLGIIKALNASGCSPVRLTPVVGVTTGAHYRMSTGHSSPAQITNLRGPRKELPLQRNQKSTDCAVFFNKNENLSNLQLDCIRMHYLCTRFQKQQTFNLLNCFHHEQEKTMQLEN